MSQHIEPSSRTQIVFTRDFREFIRGGFRPGASVTVRYDPYRIVPPGDNYSFGDPGRPILAHLQFNEGGPVTDVALVSHTGIHDHVTDWKARRVPMLSGEVTIPDDADWVTIWFSFTSGGRQVYDSNHGKNFRLRFYRDEFKILESTIRNLPDKPLNEFVCRVAVDPGVEWVKARYRVMNVGPESPVTVVDLHRTGKSDTDGNSIWETHDVLVPNEAVVAYDIVYFADGHPFKDDNQGAYFLACLPEALKKAGY
jgi:Family of unknown function (DUF6209)